MKGFFGIVRVSTFVGNIAIIRLLVTGSSLVFLFRSEETRVGALVQGTGVSESIRHVGKVSEREHRSGVVSFGKVVETVLRSRRDKRKKSHYSSMKKHKNRPSGINEGAFFR